MRIEIVAEVKNQWHVVDGVKEKLKDPPYSLVLFVVGNAKMNIKNERDEKINRERGI